MVVFRELALLFQTWKKPKRVDVDGTWEWCIIKTRSWYQWVDQSCFISEASLKRIDDTFFFNPGPKLTDWKSKFSTNGMQGPGNNELHCFLVKASTTVDIVEAVSWSPLSTNRNDSLFLAPFLAAFLARRVHQHLSGSRHTSGSHLDVGSFEACIKIRLISRERYGWNEKVQVDDP